MISFYPGPSQLYPGVERFMNEAFQGGILSQNHRSPAFVEMNKQTLTLLKEKLLIPEDYKVFYASSATECWEIIAQSLISKKSLHIYNGAFGEKWHDYTRNLGFEADNVQFERNEAPELIKADNDVDLVCLTHNETSNGTRLPEGYIKQVADINNSALVAVDATSSMAGEYLDFSQADVWFASVQKCFGLPAGLAVLICSPKAINKAYQLNVRRHYNGLVFMDEMLAKWQTTYTPNVLGIFLLGKVMEEVRGIQQVSENIVQRRQSLEEAFNNLKQISLFVQKPELRSNTVICLHAGKSLITAVKRNALKSNLLLGNGYGRLSESTFRIANFPAIDDQGYLKLIEFLKTY